MGCDIHTYIEYRNVRKDKDTWICGDYFKLNSNYSNIEDKYDIVHIYDNRDYRLFSILADVRNYSGNMPISQPKGLPNDCCDFVNKEYEYDYGDSHSCSYFTLDELIKYYNANPKIKCSGFISPIDANNLDLNNKTPNGWCQGTSDTSWIHREWEVENDSLLGLINQIKQRLKDLLWLYSDKQIEEHLENIRIVFWFDN